MYNQYVRFEKVVALFLSSLSAFVGVDMKYKSDVCCLTFKRMYLKMGKIVCMCFVCLSSLYDCLSLCISKKKMSAFCVCVFYLSLQVRSFLRY